jgi:hypothetical protein
MTDSYGLDRPPPPPPPPPRRLFQESRASESRGAAAARRERDQATRTTDRDAHAGSTDRADRTTQRSEMRRSSDNQERSGARDAGRAARHEDPAGRQHDDARTSRSEGAGRRAEATPGGQGDHSAGPSQADRALFRARDTSDGEGRQHLANVRQALEGHAGSNTAVRGDASAGDKQTKAGTGDPAATATQPAGSLAPPRDAVPSPSPQAADRSAGPSSPGSPVEQHSALEREYQTLRDRVARPMEYNGRQDDLRQIAQLERRLRSDTAAAPTDGPVQRDRTVAERSTADRATPAATAADNTGPARESALRAADSTRAASDGPSLASSPEQDVPSRAYAEARQHLLRPASYEGRDADAQLVAREEQAQRSRPEPLASGLGRGAAPSGAGPADAVRPIDQAPPPGQDVADRAASTERELADVRHRLHRPISYEGRQADERRAIELEDRVRREDADRRDPAAALRRTLAEAPPERLGALARAITSASPSGDASADRFTVHLDDGRAFTVSAAELRDLEDRIVGRMTSHPTDAASRHQFERLQVHAVLHDLETMPRGGTGDMAAIRVPRADGDGLETRVMPRAEAQAIRDAVRDRIVDRAVEAERRLQAAIDTAYAQGRANPLTWTDETGGAILAADRAQGELREIQQQARDGRLVDALDRLPAMLQHAAEASARVPGTLQTMEDLLTNLATDIAIMVATDGLARALAPELRVLAGELRATAQTTEEQAAEQIQRAVQAEARAASTLGPPGAIIQLSERQVANVEAAVRHRATQLGIPEAELNRISSLRNCETRRAFNPGESRIGGADARGIEVDAGIFDDNHPHFAQHPRLARPWQHLGITDRIDTTLVHERFERMFQTMRARFDPGGDGRRLVSGFRPELGTPGHQWSLQQAAGPPGQFPGLSHAARAFLNLRRLNRH